MKKQKKFALEKFQVAKLKNMKKITGGGGEGNPTNDHELTDVIRKLSSNIC